MLRIAKSLDAIDQAESPAALQRIWQRFVEDRGFAAFEYVDLGDGPSIRLGTADRWRESYFDSKFARVDPYLDRARRTDLLFDWSCVPLEQRRQGPARPLMEAAYDHGLRQGLVAPQHYRGADGVLRSHVCALFWTDEIGDFERRLRGEKHALQLATLHFFARVRHFRSEADDSATPGLTLREREILRLAALGRTNRDLARDIGISEQTAEVHMRNILRKLDAANRTHAVSLGLARGLIHL